MQFYLVFIPALAIFIWAHLIACPEKYSQTFILLTQLSYILLLLIAPYAFDNASNISGFLTVFVDRLFIALMLSPQILIATLLLFASIRKRRDLTLHRKRLIGIANFLTVAFGTAWTASTIALLENSGQS